MKSHLKLIESQKKTARISKKAEIIKQEMDGNFIIRADEKQ